MTAPAAGLPRDARPPAMEGSSGVGLATAAVALVVIVAALLAVVGWRLSSQTAANRHSDSRAVDTSLTGPAAQAAQAAAVSEVRATLTYDYRHLATDYATADKGLTPAFRASYDATATKLVTPNATKYHAVSTAAVTDAGVSAAGSTSATVLLFVDQTVTNTQLSAPRLDRSRIKVSMVLQGGRWLVNGLTPL